MSMSPTSKPKRREAVEAQPLPDGSGLLFDPLTATAYPITESALLIWQSCDGDHTVTTILEDLEEHYEIDRPVLERDILLLLEDLTQRGLLEASPSPE